MDWRTPERVFGSGLDAVVLRALWTAGRPLTGEQVARVARDGSPRGVRYALQRLGRFGIATSTTVGPSILYEVNTSHLTYPAVDAAFRALDPWTLLRERLTATIDEQYPGGEVTVALFGSVARGDADADSDVDVLLVVPEEDDHAADVRSMLGDRIRAWTGRPAGIYLTTPGRLAAARNESDPIIDSFRSDAVTLVGPDAHRYLDEAA